MSASAHRVRAFAALSTPTQRSNLHSHSEHVPNPHRRTRISPLPFAPPTAKQAALATPSLPRGSASHFFKPWYDRRATRYGFSEQNCITTPSPLCTTLLTTPRPNHHLYLANLPISRIPPQSPRQPPRLPHTAAVPSPTHQLHQKPPRPPLHFRRKPVKSSQQHGTTVLRTTAPHPTNPAPAFVAALYDLDRGFVSSASRPCIHFPRTPHLPSSRSCIALHATRYDLHAPPYRTASRYCIICIADLRNIHVYCGDTTHLRSPHTPRYLPYPHNPCVSLYNLKCNLYGLTATRYHTHHGPVSRFTATRYHTHATDSHSPATRFGPPLTAPPSSHPAPPVPVCTANCIMSQQPESVPPLTTDSHTFRLVLRPVVPGKSGQILGYPEALSFGTTGLIWGRVYVRGGPPQQG